MKHRRINIFGRQTSLALEDEYWRWIGEIRAKTGASVRDVIEAVFIQKPPSRSLTAAIRVAIAAHFHGNPYPIYFCPGHAVPARDNGLHWFRSGPRKKARTKSARRDRT